MTAPQALLVLAALVLLTLLIGVVRVARSGRGRPERRPLSLTAADLDGRPLGAAATFVQFGTATCGPCRTADRVLERFVATRPGVAHIDVDLAEHPGLASRFGIVEVPTTLLVDPTGAVRARFTGVPRAGDLSTFLDQLIGGSHVH